MRDAGGPPPASCFFSNQAMAEKVRVRFLCDRKTKEAVPQVFEKDKEYDVSPDSAAAFIRRGQAELVEAATKGKSKKSDESA